MLRVARRCRNGAKPCSGLLPCVSKGIRQAAAAACCMRNFLKTQWARRARGKERRKRARARPREAGSPLAGAVGSRRGSGGAGREVRREYNKDTQCALHWGCSLTIQAKRPGSQSRATAVSRQAGGAGIRLSGPVRQTGPTGPARRGQATEGAARAGRRTQRVRNRFYGGAGGEFARWPISPGW
jgi:hypothetical protein